MPSTQCSSSYPFDLLLVQMLMVISLIIVGSAMADDKPVVYLFGDSTFDVGTNNHLETKARADFPYNGIDYPHSIPTGRFSNGYNTADQIVRLFGYQQSPPPFFALLENPSTFQRNLLLGVNFASGGSGILDSTGQSFGKVLSMSQQVQQFATVQGNITQLLGPDAAAQFLAKSLFLISVGSNDIFENYDSNSSTSFLTQVVLMETLRSNYINQLKSLYDLGARKLGIVGVPPVGCCPAARLRLNLTTISGIDGCSKGMNDYAVSFYSMVSDVLENMSSQQQGMVYSLGDAFNMTITVIKDALACGFTEIGTACCGKGTLNAEQPCKIAVSPNLCTHRRDHLFWDMFHPTEAAANLAALTLYGGAPDFVVPMNFSQLASTRSGY